MVRLWPTPTARDWKTGHKGTDKQKKMTPNGYGCQLNDMVDGGKLNPTWVEWLMRWPLGWTDCEPLEMDKFQLWRRQHGGS
jgi:DNA (cytosine-5)-methyltransferase 1